MLAQRATQLEPAGRIDGGKRFVKEECLWVGDQDARERGALRLAAAESTRA